jgi:methyltransferase (TIGR00027 family)
VRDAEPSRTAAYVAAARQFGRLLPQPLRLVDDPYGAAFATGAMAHVVERMPRQMAALPAFRSWVLYMQVRTRVIDDQLRAFVASGGRQLVVLGAGYDCRALRLPELAGARVLEVDHPATQAHKREVLTRLGHESPARYVEWNFETRAMDELPDTLAAAGLDRTAPAFTIWEGVTMYLTEPAIDATLRAIRAYSAPGSRLAMTYFEKRRMTRPSLIRMIVSRWGEPWRFGWAPDELPGYLAARGFALVEDHDLADAARTLLPAKQATRLRWGGRRAAFARAESIALVG